MDDVQDAGGVRQYADCSSLNGHGVINNKYFLKVTYSTFKGWLHVFFKVQLKLKNYFYFFGKKCC